MKRLPFRLPWFVVSFSFGVFVTLAGARDKPKPEDGAVKPEKIEGCYELTMSERSAINGSVSRVLQLLCGGRGALTFGRGRTP
jgi:hypothetical protein